jgi:hypothetical protein
MPFYIRKSFRLGPLRLNLSKSGLGASAGVKGARIATGSRGTQVHAGRYGLYYRKRLGRGAWVGWLLIIKWALYALLFALCAGPAISSGTDPSPEAVGAAIVGGFIIRNVSAYVRSR